MADDKLKIIVSGALGMLGSDLVRELKGRGTLFGFDRVSAKDAEKKKVYECLEEYASIDITNRESLERYCAHVSPDVIIHTAAYTDVDKAEQEKTICYDVNVKGTGNLAGIAAQGKARFVYISTDYVFDGAKKTPYVEEDAPAPLNEYGMTKLLGEEKVRQAHGDFYLIRTSWLFGKEGRNFVDTILNLAHNNPILNIVDDQKGRPTYTVDLARALRSIIEKNIPYGVYHVANQGVCSWYELALHIVHVAGARAQVNAITSGELHRKARRPAYSVLDTSKYERVTGDRIRPWTKAVEEYIAHNKEVRT